MQDIFDFRPVRLEALLTSWGEPAFRARQVIAEAWKPHATDFSDSTSLPTALRTRLNQTFSLPAPPRPRAETRAEDGTRKALFVFPKQARVESVAIPKDHRLTFCISTQAGCAMGCRFCASTRTGLIRDLSTAEIIHQVRGLSQLLGKKPTNLVFMGMGEPLQNLPAVRGALELLTHPKAWNWSPHKSIVSTCGWIPGLEAITRDPLPAKLAFSMNAVTEEQRNQIMPINRRYPLKKVVAALRDYARTTGDTVCIEYVLIKGVNDRPEDARILGRWLKNLDVKVNLISFNPVLGCDFRPPDPPVVAAFVREMRAAKILCTLRTSRGNTIAAACGQLAGQPQQVRTSA